jgi:8-oxo-dGTP pyrophosphatase MutT (NUDIX family)
VLLAFRELVPGPFEANGVVLKHNREQFRPDPQLAQPILAELVSVFDAAYTAGIEIREAPLARLVKYVKRKRLTLEVQPTVYSLFAAMNLGLRGNGPFATAIRKKWGTTGAVLNARPSPLPDPLNVIAVLVSSDDHIFISQRTSGVYERPCCFQATVGGAIAFSDESPAEAIKREFLEEFGLQVFDSQIRFLALGRNLLTGEPDLLAVVHSAGAAHEITPLFTRRISKEELLQVLDFDLADAKKVIKAVNRFPFSQDSDRAAILLALREKAGPELIQAAVRAVR